MSPVAVGSVVVLLCLLAGSVNGDVYMHNPRGSNDRNCERNVNRNNGNRVFDSQNNNKGGYACPRAVGNEEFQAEDGTASFSSVDAATGTTTTFTQNKRVYYYSGSVLPIEWTNQHGCGGNSKVSCEIVIQYACEDTLDPSVDDFWPWVENKAEVGTTYRGQQHFRQGGENIAAPRDGVPRDENDAATDTIPDNEASAIPDTRETRRFGMHESYDYYQLCQHTERNNGLYTADQRINRRDQRGTRQNPNGNRRGLECPEERDYYPWFHPSPWIDIAVLTDSTDVDDVCHPTDSTCSTRCTYYMQNTLNYNKKGYCDVNRSEAGATVQTKLTSSAWQQRRWYNNPEACHSAGFVWYNLSHSDVLNLGDDSFVCAHTQFARANQLGNARADSIVSQSETTASAGVLTDKVNHGVNANRFLWTVPEIPTTVAADETDYFTNGMEAAYKSCSVRLRYNISTADFQQWPEDAVDPGTEPMVDYRNNSQTRDDPRTPLQQNPYVYIGPGDSEEKGNMFVKLKVNTNQYGRTFQDRTFSFSIKPLPTADAAASMSADTPAIDFASMSAALANGGKIYNVNVRGKRGNIVQTYPSVEYDFVPNALALSTNDMIHFQWTGSDYNPRRGCNDATGGPPDANTFSTDANANINPRADRSNVVFTNYMGQNTPKDYLGFDLDTTTMTFSEQSDAAQETVLANAPCYDAATDTAATAEQCYETVMRLAYLNQQSDSGSLVLRAGKDCLTADELDEISSQDVADFHPLNCAKINAKPYSYFDGGLMFMKKSGWFPFFSSRNNNFSNREQIGVICVGNDCSVDSDTGVLQDQNPATSGLTLRATGSTCYDTAAGGEGQANANGVLSCLPAAGFSSDESYIISGESLATQEGDNDAMGDGNEDGCTKLSFGSTLGSTDDDVALAVGLLFLGLFCSWLAYYLYNRYQARREGESKFRYETAWIAAAAPDKKSGAAAAVAGSATAGGGGGSGKKSSQRPKSGNFAEANPGIKMSRMPSDSKHKSSSSAGASPAKPMHTSSGKSPTRPASAGSAKPKQRYNMI